jgi:chromosomal replication initiation ATPase DnaA
MPQAPKVPFVDVVEFVLWKYNLEGNPIPKHLLFSHRRLEKLCRARQIIWAMARDLCVHLSFPALGSMSGGRDHTTILYGVKQGRKDPRFESWLAEFQETML